MRTRPKKPTRLKKLLGNPGRRPLNENEPKPLRSGEPDAPEWLTPLAKAEWAARIPELGKMGVVAKIDQMTCAAYCELFSRWRCAEEVYLEMANADPVTRGLLMRMPGTGAVIRNPVIDIANAALRDMLKAGSLIGLNPSARAGLEAVPDEETDLIMRKYFPGGRRG